jgi:hypothetical protein
VQSEIAAAAGVTGVQKHACHVKVSSIFKQQKKPTDPYFINNTMVVQGI